MPLISKEDQDVLRDRFSKSLIDPVNLVLFTQRESPLTVPAQECMYCQQTRELLEDIAGLSEKIDLTVFDLVADADKAAEYGIDKTPAIVFDSARNVRYFGIPAGYEFSTLIEDIIDVSAGRSDLAASTKDALQKLDRDLRVQVFVTPTWPYCPKAARLAHKMAIENTHIKADVVEASEFPFLVEKYHIMGVPKVVVDDKVEFEGALPEDKFVEEVLKAAGP